MRRVRLRGVLHLLAAVAVLLPASASATGGLEWVSWEQALKTANAEKRTVYAHFSASWCKPCKDLKDNVYTQPAVAKRLAHFVLTEVDTEKEPGAGLWMTLKESNLPIMAFYDANGAERSKQRIRGAKTADQLVELLDDAMEEEMARREMSPEQERAAAKGRSTSNRTTRTKVRGGEWQTTDTSWLGTAVMIMLGVLLALLTLFVVLKARRQRQLEAKG